MVVLGAIGIQDLRMKPSWRWKHPNFDASAPTQPPDPSEIILVRIAETDPDV
jgi:hypothetical protein